MLSALATQVISSESLEGRTGSRPPYIGGAPKLDPEDPQQQTAGGQFGGGHEAGCGHHSIITIRNLTRSGNDPRLAP